MDIYIYALATQHRFMGTKFSAPVYFVCVQNDEATRPAN